jgi:hypothetical protein
MAWPRHDEPQVILSTKLPESFANVVRQRAKAEDRNIANFIKRVLMQALRPDHASSDDVSNHEATE